MERKKRKLKVYATGTRFVDHRWKPYPEIRLRGDYLTAIGFKIDSRYTVEASQGKLVLQVEEE